ncbi:unnamed protein product [Pleuronectes platessa]|uniref:Uncharacterized protein n=1 Tax=Pleuronectes platessa TaxID=8262 RepID=A0A9N7Y3P4_PLEPL|nr:unnamed protein product [Pleuronectes platessa]
MSDSRWGLWRQCDSEKRSASKCQPRDKESLMARLLMLLRVPLTPRPRWLSAHQSRDRQQKRGRTSSHLSKSRVTPLIPAAFMPPDTEFKVISPLYLAPLRLPHSLQLKAGLPALMALGCTEAREPAGHQLPVAPPSPGTGMKGPLRPLGSA